MTMAAPELTQAEVDAALANLDQMLRTLADRNASESERLDILATLSMLPEPHRSQLPPVVQMFLSPPEVKISAVCTFTYPEGVEPPKE